MFCEVEGCPRPGRALEEKVDDGLALERWDFFYWPLENLSERRGGFEYQFDIFLRHPFQSEEMSAL